MIVRSEEQKSRTGPLRPASGQLSPAPAFPLAESDVEETLAFLHERPIHTFGMAGLIRDNGLVSTQNRGEFYGYRNRRGRLEGVALIGHSTLLEARNERAVQALAKQSQNCEHIFMVLGEQVQIEEFWRTYSQTRNEPTISCRELLLEKRSALRSTEMLERLTPAVYEDLDTVIPIHAGLAADESGLDPLVLDPEGFRRRCARRIERERTWLWKHNGELVFKADIVSDTPDVIYIEGIWVSPRYRGKGYGLRCLLQFSAQLLQRTRTICLLVNERNMAARKFYERAGFSFVSAYDSIFINRSALPNAAPPPVA